MARRFPKAKWVLPATVDPVTRKCITIEVPDDPQHIAAFWGALLNLASAYNWQDDSAHTAKDVALVWRDIINGIAGNWGCNLLEDVRQNDTLPCVLEKNLSGEWQPFANLRYCPPNLRVSGGKIQYFDEATQTWVDYPDNTGGSAPGSQPGGQTGGDQPIPVGECRQILLTTQGNSVTAVPFRVSPGDSVELSAIVGGWTYNASSTSFTWMCGTGKIYALGQCGTTNGDTTGAIIAGVPLGKLICQYGAHFFDAQSIFIIPSGWDESTLFLRMNDPDITDNAGSVTALVEVCAGEWCFDADFSVDDYAFTRTPDVSGNNYLGVWDGTAWQSQDGLYSGNYRRGVWIRLVLSATTRLTYMKIWFDFTAGTPQEGTTVTGSNVAITGPSAVTLLAASQTPNGTNVSREWSGSALMSEIRFAVQSSSDTTPPYTYGGVARIRRIQLKGRGDIPTELGASNC